MDTPMHARALPDTDPATLKRPSQSAEEILALLAASMRGEATAVTAAVPAADAVPPIASVDHLHVFVQDRAAAERWYADVLGLRRVDALTHWAADGGPLTLADDADRVHLALFERPPQPNRATIALGVDAAAFIAWRAHLARWLGAAPEAVDHDQSWSIYFSDPDRNPYEITCYQHDTIAAALQAEGAPR
jgi:catechol 2,3-dioxygenase-like lactoylglutathione lyase family enzyme